MSRRSWCRRKRKATSSSSITSAHTRATRSKEPSAPSEQGSLFLPPYSPEFNPIEQALGKLKALLRKAEERTLEALWRRICSLLDAFSPAECTNYFRNSGYGSR
jgi:transposase